MGSDRIAAGRAPKARALLRRPSLVFGLALAVVLVGLGGSASAAITGLERISAVSPSNSANKSITATCPAGKRVVGAGGEINAGFGQVALGFVRPDATLGSVTAQGREDENGSANNWTVTAFAICAPPPPGLERVSAASPSNSSNKSVTATCPAGKRLLGTGAEIDGGGGQATPNDVIPGSTLKAATVQGLEDENGTAVNWRARAYAICATPVAGLERVAFTSPTNSLPDKNAFASCPAGKQLTGVGGELGGGGGEVVFDDLTPEGGLEDVAVRAFEDEDGTSANWFARAFAICAAASERIVATSPNNSITKQVLATCPTGKQMTGGGGDITGGGGQVALETFPPFTNSFVARGFEDETGISSNWLLRAYAICAPSLPGLELVSNSSPTDSDNKSVNVPCPFGKRVVGAGGEIENGAGQVALHRFVAFADLSGVVATGVEDQNGYANNWSVTAHAVCANPPPGLEVVDARTEPDTDFSASVPATCPSGKNLLGTGADIATAGGGVFLDDVRPNAALTRVTVAAFEEESGLGLNWSLLAQAICANP